MTLRVSFGDRPNAIDLGCCSLGTSGVMSRNSLGLLGSAEKSRLGELRRPDDQARFVASRALLRRALSRKRPQRAPQDWNFTRESSGQWKLTGESNVFFSTAHCDLAAAVAISQKAPVGVDVERVVPDLDPKTLASALTPDELKWVDSFSVEKRGAKALRIWSAKEAYTKFTGLGADLDPQSFEVRFQSEAASLGNVIRDNAIVAQISCMEMPLKGQDFIYAVATIPDRRAAQLVFQRPEEVWDA